MASEPAVAFERAAEPTVDLVVSAAITSDSADPTPLTYNAFVVLHDAAGNALRMERKNQLTAVAAGEPRTVTLRINLTPEEFNALASVRFICYGWHNALSCISAGNQLYPVEGARQAYIAAEQERLRLEAERAQRQHEEQWRAKFPTDDYSNTLLIGDSIMQNCSASLKSTLPGVTVDADAGRTLEYGGLVFEGESPNDGVLDHIRRDDGSYARYVIGTGNNDVGGVTVEDAEEMIGLLGPEKEIYFVTEYVRGNAHGTAVTNATIEEMVAKYSNVHIVDWYGLVHERPSEYLKDGCHPRADREGDYAECMKQALDVIY